MFGLVLGSIKKIRLESGLYPTYSMIKTLSNPYFISDHRQADTHTMPPWVKMLFLQWLPWLLRMSRPGEKLTRKMIMMQSKMKELDMKETSSKSLLANVLDMDDDYIPNRKNIKVSTVNNTFYR